MNRSYLEGVRNASKLIPCYTKQMCLISMSEEGGVCEALACKTFAVQTLLLCRRSGYCRPEIFIESCFSAAFHLAQKKPHEPSSIRVFYSFSLFSFWQLHIILEMKIPFGDHVGKKHVGKRQHTRGDRSKK